MINEFFYRPLEKKIISKNQRFKILKKDLIELRSTFRNKNILISGAAGSIGSQFTKDIWKHKLKPKKIILLDKDENQLTELNRDLLRINNFKVDQIEFVCSDLTSINLDNFLSKKKIEFYLNFAAIKHVRSEENIDSIRYMFKTNSISCFPKKNKQLKKIFSISTDKTVNPSSVLGISKHLMEINLKKYSNKKTFVSSVRFANVAFSNGSILKYAFEKILQKKNFGIPEKVRRFFITHEEASILCFKSLLNRNNKKIIIPNPKILKKDYLIHSLVKKIIQGFNYSPKFVKKKFSKNYKNKICNVLLTPLSDGQKTYEELIGTNEKIETDYDKTVCKVEMQGYKKKTNNLLNKILKIKDLKKLKVLLIQNFNNYNPPKKTINISKII